MLSLSTGTLPIEITELLLVVLPLAVKQSLELSVLSVSLSLDSVKLLLEASLALESLLKSLLK